jgi:hypothetical protein
MPTTRTAPQRPVCGWSVGSLQTGRCGAVRVGSLQGYLPEPTRTYPNRAGARPIRSSHGPIRGPRRSRCWHRQPASRVQQESSRLKRDGAVLPPLCSRPCVTSPKASPSPPPPTHPHPPPQQPARHQSPRTVYSRGTSPTHREPSLRRATIVAHSGLATWHGSTRAPSRISRCERHPLQRHHCRPPRTGDLAREYSGTTAPP